ncbi:MBL fold metallo-hydrolase [Streptomyces gibsoniae]|uniref:MBL fold metallo-hydrolase n=1 Tax=Streptomyces gibsoniae TaxID=3075529 RepID=A0ABU2TYR2_9ACTN|nr:MBL fold metallo-hydrolase [Streptomyces sp. DSM 41699]MDT0465975.1 MBL fold metallo-hydrolase [Streptomyces sp. DSM 41699]
MTLPAGVVRLGDPLVNFYLLQEGTDLTLVDAGLPSHWGGLSDRLESLGRSVRDIRAVLVTHGHLDHFGIARRVSAEAGAQVWVHDEDAPILRAPRRTRRYWRPERSLARYAVRRPSALRAPLHLARSGALGTAAVPVLRSFRDGEVLDVPGRPQAVHTPGHTAGSTTFLLPGRAVAFTGDALVTDDSVTGRQGPCLLCRAFTQDSTAARESLRTLGTLDADLVLPGHGEPWTGGIAEAARLGLESGVV